jgi:hypothetical protein
MIDELIDDDDDIPPPVVQRAPTIKLKLKNAGKPVDSKPKVRFEEEEAEPSSNSEAGSEESDGMFMFCIKLHRKLTY